MTTQIRLFQKFELPIERGQLKSCEICGTKFSVFVAEHQCKRCLRAVCSGCGSAKRDVYKPQMGRKPHRLCKICNVESTILIEYISANKLSFGSDSEIARKWRKKIPKPIRDQANVKQQRKFTVQIFNQLWDAYNFSLREFIGLHTYLIGQGEVYKLINTVYQELQSRGVEEKLENVILMIVFMLCYSGTDTCANLVEYLCNLKKTIMDQKQMVQAYLRALGIEDSESKKLNDYISYKSKQFLGSLSINAVTAQCSIHVVTKAFERQRIDQTFMLLAIVLQENWEMLLKNRSQKKQCDYHIIRNCNMNNYIQKYKSLVSVKVSQFSSIRASLKNVNTDDIKDQKPKQTTQNQQIRESLDNTPPKMMMDKKQTQQKLIVVAETDSDLRTKALRNIARIKQENQRKRQQESEESIDDDEELKVIKGQSQEGALKMTALNLIQTNMFDQKNNQATNPRIQKIEVSRNEPQPVTVPQRLKNEPIVHYEREHCSECIKKNQKLQDLEDQLKSKSEEAEQANRLLKLSEKQVQRLKIEIKRMGEEAMKRQEEDNKDASGELEKLKVQLVEGNSKYSSLMKQFLKFQKQNKLLKNEVEELALNNKILKSKLEQSSMGLSITARVSQNEQELTRMNQLLKKSIEGKNRQLQVLSKKNKELLTQLDEQLKSRSTENSKETQKAMQLQRQKDELMYKMKDLGERIVREEQEKLSLSSELFQLKRSYSTMPVLDEKAKETEDSAQLMKSRASQCLIF